MGLEAEEAVHQRIIPLLLQQGDGEELPLGLAHLARVGVQVVDMHPVFAPGVAQVRLRLGDLVGMVGESVVDAAAVDVQVLPQILHGDTGALDVPAGVAHAPGGVPLEGLILELGLGEPQHKVVLVALVGVLLHALADAHGQILLVVVVEHIILLQLGGVEVDVAAGEVGVALVHEGGDDLDIVTDHAGSGLHHVGVLDVQLLAVGKEGIGIKLGDLHHGLVLPLGPLEHLVLAGVGVGGQVSHVGDVHDAGDVIARIAEQLLQHVLHDIAAQIADVSKVVHCGAAGVHGHLARLMGDKLLLGVGCGIVDFHRFLLLACSSISCSSHSSREFNA